jgi:hypothetical protein
MTKVDLHSFSRRVIRTGMILAAIRLGIYGLLVVLDRSFHPGVGFLPLLLIVGIIFFPDCMVLEGWLKTPVAFSGLMTLTSFLVAAIWILITGSARYPRMDSPTVRR